MKKVFVKIRGALAVLFGQNKHILVCFLSGLFVITIEVQSQSITVNETVPVEFGVLPPVIPGDPPQESYESTMGDVQISVDGGNKFGFWKTWYVTVEKADISWHSSLSVEVRRDPAETKAIGGTAYLTVPDSPSSAFFFQSNDSRRVSAMGMQHRVQINGEPPPAGNYTTTIIYTLIDIP